MFLIITLPLELAKKLIFTLMVALILTLTHIVILLLIVSLEITLTFSLIRKHSFSSKQLLTLVF